MSGFNTNTWTEAGFTLGAAVTKNNFTSNAIIGPTSAAARPIVPQGFFAAVPNGIGRSLWLRAAGTMATTAAATVVITLVWNPTPGTIGTTLATPWPVLAPTAAVTCPWVLDVVITAQAVGAAGLTLQTSGEMRVGVVAAGTLSTAPQSIMLDTSTSGLNSESLAELTLAATWSAAAAGNTTTIKTYNLVGLS